MVAPRYHGIDFSGGAPAWKARCGRPAVWISTITASQPDVFDLADLRPVQALDGDGTPFERLVRLLRQGDFTAAAIDAPYSIPSDHLPPGGHGRLLALVRGWTDARDRPFPRGHALVELATAQAPLAHPKPLRATERFWRSQGLPARSTLWNGTRPGAPFAVACLSLLARAERPIWPWSSGAGMLVEAYPAAQLATWGLPHQGYSKATQEGARVAILKGLTQRLRIDNRLSDILRTSPDALDAVVAAFGGVAAATGTTVSHEVINEEGMIAVERAIVGAKRETAPPEVRDKTA